MWQNCYAERAMRLLIDADGLIYRCGFAVEKTKYLVTDPIENNYAVLTGCDNSRDANDFIKQTDPDSTKNLLLWSRKEFEPVENAYHLINQVIDSMPEHDTRELWLSPSVGNFREQIAKQAKYKGNRDYANRPKYYRELTEYLIDRFGAKYTEGQEADDELGIRATEEGDRALIVSFDKDLLQIPGRHYNWVTKETTEISPKDAALNFYAQILSGDPVDNVPGLPGIGSVKARKILSGVVSPSDAWERVKEAYINEFGDDGIKYALETARLVYVRRKRNELWEPPVKKRSEAA